MVSKRSENSIFLKRCFDLARLGNGMTSPNPSVGSVIVHNGQIIGEGFHQRYGSAHAEVNAVANVSNDKKHLLPESSIFVTLEPCYHYGKTPPCVDLILKERITRVNVAFTDPNPKVAGQSLEKLRRNGVETTVFHRDTEGPNFDREMRSTLLPFFTNVERQRPYVILKWAESADGFIGRRGERTAISNAYAQRLVHKWRSESDAIMVGTNTALIDNPALDNRFYFGKSPRKILIDRHGKLPAHLNVFQSGELPILFGETRIEGRNCQFEYVESGENYWHHVLKRLFELKIGILFVEGGAELHRQLIQHGLWDEARVLKSATLLRGGIAAPQLEKARLIESFDLADNRVTTWERT